MKYKPFWPGDKIITIVDYDGIPSGTMGTIASRWSGIVYLIRIADGTFRWISDRSFAPVGPPRESLQEGEFGVVTSDERQKFAKVGETYKVFKVLNPVDYYGVFIDDELRWFGGFQLAKIT